MAISTAVNLSVLYTSYDESVDKKIEDFAEDWSPPLTEAPIIETTTTKATTTTATTTTTSTTTSTTPRITTPEPRVPYDFEAIGLGLIRGYVHSRYEDVVEFKGVPFAEPPIGNLRFKAPVPLSVPWEGTYDADTAPRCLQAFEQTVTNGTGDGGTEDCLYLSLYVPKSVLESNNADVDKPVVYLYFHGGAYLGGSSNVIGTV